MLVKQQSAVTQDHLVLSLFKLKNMAFTAADSAENRLLSTGGETTLVTQQSTCPHFFIWIQAMNSKILIIN